MCPVPSFSCYGGDPNSDPHTCVADALLPEHLPSPSMYLSWPVRCLSVYRFFFLSAAFPLGYSSVVEHVPGIYSSMLN